MDIILIPLLSLISSVIGLYTWIVIIHVIMSWLVSFNIINTGNQFVALINNFLYAATEPVLHRIRRILPNMSGLDLSPLVLIFSLMFLSNVMARLIAKMM